MEGWVVQHEKVAVQKIMCSGCKVARSRGGGRQGLGGVSRSDGLDVLKLTDFLL